MSIFKEQSPQNSEEKICLASCDKMEEVKEYINQFKRTGDLQYLDWIHYCLFKIREQEKGIIRS